MPMIFLNRKITNRLLIFQMVILLVFLCLGHSLVAPMQSFNAPTQSLSDKTNFSGTYLTSYDSYFSLQVLKPEERNRNLKSLSLLYNAFISWAFSTYILHLLKINKIIIPQQDVQLGLFKKLRRLLNPKDNGSKYKTILLWT
jgi:hypothetical protein